MTYEQAKEKIRKLGYYLGKADPEFDPTSKKYILHTYAGGYALFTDSLDDALKFAKEENKPKYFADDPRDIGGAGFETTSLKKMIKWARKVANDSGHGVLVYISKRNNTELYTHVMPGGR